MKIQQLIQKQFILISEPQAHQNCKKKVQKEQQKIVIKVYQSQLVLKKLFISLFRKQKLYQFISSVRQYQTIIIFKHMSFQAQFQQYDKQNKQLFDGYIKRTTQLPLQLQQLIQGNEKKLSLFIQNFQSQIVTLKKSQQRDSKLINNLNQENNQRRSQTILIQSATKMQENIVQKLKNNLNIMNFTVKNIEQRIHKHQENMNRYQIDFQNIENKSKNKANNGIIQIDREGEKLLIRIDKNGHKNYEVLYNKKEDKFSGNYGDKQIAQAIIQFNFHRDLNKLCADLYQNS